jgi:hypothetical protein
MDWNTDKTQCVRKPRWISDGEDLKKFLLSRGYTAGNCPKTGDPPNGSVKFWSLAPYGGIKHSSVMLSNNRQIEMGHEGYEKTTIVSAILSPGEDPKPLPLASGIPRKYTQNVSKSTPHGMLCPPSNSLRDMKRIEGMKGIARYGEDKRDNTKADNWNCHGFSAYLIYNYVETFMRVRPDTNINWDQVLEIGALHGYKPIVINIPQGQVRIRSEYTIEVRDDQTAVIHVIEGKADYKGIGHSLSLSSGQMGVIDPTGVPSAPTTFNISEMDQWWTELNFFPETSQEKEGLTFESNSNPSGSSVQIPLTLNGIEDKIGNMDITLSYDPSVLEATEVTKGDLTADALFEYNILAGTILISLADAEGFSGNGTIAYVTFNVTGATGSTSPLQIAALTANRAEDYEALTIPTNDGLFKVESGLTVSVSDTTGAKGSTVEVPINLEGASEVGSMDIILNYDANVLSAVDVEAGALGKNALIESNTARKGGVIITLADSSGISGDGAVASVAFEVIGDAGTTSYLTLEDVLVHNLDLGEIIPTTVNGTFLVI